MRVRISEIAVYKLDVFGLSLELYQVNDISFE